MRLRVVSSLTFGADDKRANELFRERYRFSARDAIVARLSPPVGPRSAILWRAQFRGEPGNARANRAQLYIQ
jgi:hypothetical protein